MNRLLELLRQHSFFLAAILILWRALAAIQAGEMPPVDSAGAVTSAPPRLGPEDLPERRGDEVLHPGADPFYVEMLLQLEREEEAARLAAMAVPAPAPVEAEVEVPAIGHVLTLEATIPGAAPRAWVNGQDLGLGDALTGVDENAPPVLIGVQGTSAFLDYRGDTLRLDLDVCPSLVIFVKPEQPSAAPPANPPAEELPGEGA